MAYVISDECAVEHAQLNVQLKQFLKVQSISKSMLMLALTVEHALMPVLQKLFTQLNNFIHINQKAAASAAAFLYSVTYPGAFVQTFSQQQLLPLFVQAAVCVSHNQAICIFLHLHSVPSVPA